MYAFNDNLWKYEIELGYSDQIWDDSAVVYQRHCSWWIFTQTLTR